MDYEFTIEEVKENLEDLAKFFGREEPKDRDLMLEAKRLIGELDPTNSESIISELNGENGTLKFQVFALESDLRQAKKKIQELESQLKEIEEPHADSTEAILRDSQNDNIQALLIIDKLQTKLYDAYEALKLFRQWQKEVNSMPPGADSQEKFSARTKLLAEADKKAKMVLHEI